MPLLISGLLTSIVGLRLVIVAGGDLNTAWALLRETGTGSVLLALTVTLISVLSPTLAATCALSVVSEKVGLERVVPFAIPLGIFALVAAAYSCPALNMLLVAILTLGGSLMLYRSGRAHAEAAAESASLQRRRVDDLLKVAATRQLPAQASGPYGTNLHAVRSVLYLPADRERRHKAIKGLIDEGKANIRRLEQQRAALIEERDRHIADRRVIEKKLQRLERRQRANPLTVAATSAALTLSWLLMTAPIWLPPENLVRRSGMASTVYVLREDGPDLVVLDAKTNLVRRIPPAEVESRELCRRSGSWTEPVIRLIKRSNYPECIHRR